MRRLIAGRNKPLKRCELNLLFREKYLYLFGHYSKVLGAMFAINQGEGEGEEASYKTKVFRAGSTIICPKAYDAARNFNYGQLNVQNFATVSCQLVVPPTPYPFPFPIELKYQKFYNNLFTYTF